MTGPQGEYGPAQVDLLWVVVGSCGKSLRIEVSSHPDAVVPMLAAFARAHEGS